MTHGIANTRSILLALLAYAALTGTANADNSSDHCWRSLDSPPAQPPGSRTWIRPRTFRLFEADVPALRSRLGKAPQEFTAAALTSETELLVPAPDGTYARFRIAESPIMAPALASRFSEIKTYSGQGIDDPMATIRCDWTPDGFHASVLTPSGSWYVDPHWKGHNKVYTSYRKRDLEPAAPWVCLFENTTPTAARAAANISSGGSLRVYRLACAATAEYTAFHGGTVAAGQAAIVTAMNRVNQVYEADLAIRMVLVANNDQLVYTNAKKDPYKNDNANLLLNQNQSNCDAVIGDANYDIGHVMGTGGGGLAYLGVVCEPNWKARGETGSSEPTGDGYYIDYVAHEMGHQFGANHCFNGVTANCSGQNRNASTAMEPGSGTTIMCYAGICGADDLQPHSDPYFHSISYDEIMAYTTTGAGSGCPAIVATGNAPPVVSAGSNRTIPKLTAFTLTAAGSDPNGDPLTWCWEERDLGAAQLVTDPDNGASPIFRSFNPAAAAQRTFPQLDDIVNNTLTKGEQYPAVARTAMQFRVTGRDNRPSGGGSASSDMTLQISGSAGPFRVTSPNTAVVWSGQQTIAWDVAGSNLPPISTASVNILLSTDSGRTFPTVLAASAPNNGSQMVTLPDINTNTARVKIEAVGNIYWDMSDTVFTITRTTPVSLSAFTVY